jgi:2-polyprenyl-6-methoxyphenol hydroxylase-like FAD-dependent oxidoreductase
MYDAIVIGARCAGSPTAMLLARKGYRVLLVDKAAFPSDSMSTHFIWQAGVARLKRWGLLDRLRSTNCPPVTVISLDVGPFVLRGTPPPTADGVAEGYGPRRTALDKILIDAAAQAGAEVRERFAVQELSFEGGRVSGLRGRTEGGAPVEERARIVIGADGRNSLVAGAVKAREYHTSPPLCPAYYTYWSGVPCSEFEQYFRDGWGMAALPTNDGLTCMVAGWSAENHPDYRTQAENLYLKYVTSIPGVAERIRNGKREEPYRGIVEIASFFRQPYGDGWALVGDAGFYKHPIPAQGITDAFRDAELLVDAIDAGFQGRRPLDQALADYERIRNETVMPMFESTIQRASLKPPPPPVLQLFAALRNNQAETNRFFGTDAGTVPMTEFFSPANLQRIVAGAS